MKKYKVLCLIGSIVFFFGCTDFNDLNTDPTKSTDMDPRLMIPTVQMRQSENHQEWARYLSYPAGFMNQWTGYWGTIEYGGRGQRYGNYMEQMWVSYYPIIIRDVVDIVHRTSDVPEKSNLNAIGRILKVQCFHKLTDFYGDIPYFEAGMGAISGVIRPKYDKQEDIYKDLLKELAEASEQLDPAGDEITYDLYYDGSILQWKKFANSLRLRIAMRLIKVDPALARQEAEKAIAAGVFESNDDICYVKHENTQVDSSGEGKQNGLAARLSVPEDPANNTFRVARELVETMENAKDPRLLYYAGSYYNDPSRTDITATIRALKNSYAEMALPAQNFSWDDGIWEPAVTIEIGGRNVTIDHNQQRLQPSKYITALDAPYIHISYAEVKFLMAEAAVRTWNVGGGDAQSHYEEALDAAVRQWSLFGVSNFDEDAITAFVDFNRLKSGEELMQINTQLWVLHFLDPIETWGNWRRTGMPDLKFKNVEPGKNNTNGQFPRRLEYPLEEQMKNKENLDEAIARMGGKDDWTNRVWWDKE
ncbi:MAG: SusD/RagB family nutrient-binding outer membrane lipoprotein [Prevotellaceae bacterium]|jgi:hypothetical protein|nr:SusD/RagB family nutrient-binding outer membrane lipoprotein [Prevotellaceae bacterium]